ncbi:MAG: hypothetical protein N3A01_06345 [Bacteroidales bacterium]|nr:hypothetical protein [Bacteroidales bacterium]
MRQILALLLLIFNCCTQNVEQKQEENLDKKVEEKYTDTIRTSSIYKTLPDGNVSNIAKNVMLLYNNENIKVDFGDSIWKFKITNIQRDHKGTTINIKDKKFKQIFISSGSLPIITFETHSESERVTLM